MEGAQQQVPAAKFINDDTTSASHCWSMSNMMLTEVSLIDSAILHSHTFGHTTALSTCIRPNNINHQEKRHHSRRGAPTKAQHKGSKEIQCRSKKYSVRGSKSLPRKVCQDLVLQYLLPSPSNVQMSKHHQGKSRKYVRVGHPSLGVSRLRRAYSAGEA